MTTLTGMEGLREAEGRELGVTDWHEITQAEVDAFADVTGAHRGTPATPERAPRLTSRARVAASLARPYNSARARATLSASWVPDPSPLWTGIAWVIRICAPPGRPAASP